MSSSTNSVTCVISRSVTIDLAFFHHGLYFLDFFCIFSYLLLDARHCEIAGYFCILMNILEDLNYLETV